MKNIMETLEANDESESSGVESASGNYSEQPPTSCPSEELHYNEFESISHANAPVQEDEPDPWTKFSLNAIFCTRSNSEHYPDNKFA